MAAENEKTLSDLRTLSDDIAHDLRTPLTRMRAAAELYRMNNDGSKNLSETIQEETSAMLELINTLLDISQTDNRINRTPRDNIELCTFIRNIADLYSAIVEESEIKKIELSLPKEDVYLSAHKGKLQQLFGNLLDNAVKFTPKNGRISISLSMHPIMLTVANTGPGIAPNDIPHVFKRFWRADASRSLTGNGLGLALVKAIVTSYGGTITCQSVPDEWTEFKITF
jgi:signal transduction histidine kinase